MSKTGPHGVPAMIDSQMVSVDAMVERFRQTFPDTIDPLVVAQAPGRVNLIGEHTDYNEGFVLPVAIDRAVMMIGGRARDQRHRVVRALSANFEQHAQFNLDKRRKESRYTWVNYPQGVADVLERAGRHLPAINMLTFGNVPVASGLSSSAAFEVASVLLFAQVMEYDISALDSIKVAQRAENEFVGVACGIMDQFISRQGRAGHALLLDCRDLSFEHVPVHLPGVVLGICHSGVSRGLASSAYNQRRSECEQGVALLGAALPGIRSLRDVTVSDLDQHEALLPPVVRKRCRHVVEENQRTLEAAAALRAGDAERIGRLFAQSHASLRDLYEVSCAELDALVDVASTIPGVIGSRLTGAGFGGCTVNLVREDAWDTFAATIQREYPLRARKQPTIWRCRITDGAWSRIV